MPAPNPQVSVFHFTSRISSAKIRKYKLATERGMGGGTGGGNDAATTPISTNSRANPSPATEPSSMEPPAKRPKLKLNVRAPSESADTIAVSRPKRDTALRIRYSENMVMDDKDRLEQATDEDELPRKKSRPSPAASSDLSSLTSIPSVEKEPPPPPKEVRTSSAKPRDYSRDFMSYYVDGGDEEVEEDEAAPPEPAPVEKVQPAPPPKPRNVDRPIKNRSSRVSEQPPAYPNARLQPPQPPRPPMPQPIVKVIDVPSRPQESRGPCTVADMVSKLRALSNALTTFGGITAVPASPEEEAEEEQEVIEAPAVGEKKEVDSFLAMFDDDDSDGNKDTNPKPTEPTRRLNYVLQNPGEADGPLTYGIQFIQNALKSWALQRMGAQYSQQWMQYHQARDNTQKRGPGRPRKFDNGDEDFRLPPPPPAVVEIDLAKTQEGAAIAAFQDVLDSGCLQVNAVLPVTLTRALRRLYLQIDHLINQGSRNESTWQCMSYGAQIAAQKIRVEKWKEAHAKAQEEMARQHHLAQQQVMQQMGISQHHRTQLPVDQHAIDLERKRSLQYAAQQPHLTRYLTNPLQLNTQPMSVPPAHPTPPSTTNNIPSSGSPETGPSTAQPNYPNGLPTQSSPDGKGNHMDKIKLYMPNYLPRSGQSMKFSFAPHSELALKAFGPEAFPTNHTGPNLPNRGPMSANPPTSMNHAHGANGVVSAPVVPSNVPAPNDSKEDDDDDVQMLEVVPKDPGRSASHNSTVLAQTASATGPTKSNGIGDHPAASTATANTSKSGEDAEPISATSPTALVNGKCHVSLSSSVPSSPVTVTSNGREKDVIQVSSSSQPQTVVID